MRSRVSVRVLAQVGVIGLIAALGAWLGVARERAPLINAGLIVDSSRLDVGEVWQQSDFQVELPIENPTSHKITIADLEASCSCTAIEPRTLTIPPRGRELVRLTIDLSRTLPGEPDGHTTPFEIALFPRVQAVYPSQPQAWAIRGTVRHPFLPVSPAVDLGEHLFGEIAGAEQQVLLRAYPSVVEIAAVGDPELATVGVERDPENRSQFTVSVAPTANWPEGVSTRHIDLIATTSDGRRLPPVKMAVTARILEHVSISPPGLSLGLIDPQSSTTQRITLWSRTGRPFAISRIEIPTDEVTVTRETPGDDARESLTYLVSVTPRSTGPRTALVRFGVEPFVAAEAEISLPVAWYTKPLSEVTERP